MTRSKDFIRPHGFTLIELLVVMVIISVLSGMTAMMLAGARADARAKRAQRLIETIEQVLLAEMNEMSFSAVGTQPTVLGANARMAQLIARRDQMRMAFPDRRGDLLMPPALISLAPADATRVRPPASWLRMRSKLQLDSSVAPPPAREPATTGPPLDIQLGNLWGTAGNVTWTGGSSFGLVRRVDGSSIIPTPPEDNSPTDINLFWTREHESAECLYLILSVIDYNGVPAIEMIGRGTVANTDGDLVPEIVDPWGVPLMFVRWPVGWPGLTSTSPDPLDFTQIDPRFAGATPLPPEEIPFRLRPLLLSAGEDGDFGIFNSPASLDPTTAADFTFADTTITGIAGRFPDPYFNLNQTVATGDDDNDVSVARYNATTNTQGGGFGSLIPAQAPAAEDNITNFVTR